MTKPSISLTELTEKGSDVDVLRQMIQYVVQRLVGVVQAADGFGFPLEAFPALRVGS